MPPRKKPVDALPIGDDSKSGYDPIEREVVFSVLGIKYDCKTFEDLVEVTQSLIIELVLNQFAMVLHFQQEVMKRRRPYQDIEDYRTLKITTDIMTELCAFNVGVDINRAIELLQRQGYVVTEGSDVPEPLE